MRQTPSKRWTREERFRSVVDSLAPIGSPGAQYKYSDTVPPLARDRAHQYLGGFDSYSADPSFDLYGGGGIVAPLEGLGARSMRR